MNAARASVPSQCCAPNFRPEQSLRTPFIPALPDAEVSHFIGALSSAETNALRFIADHGDLLVVDGETWLLSPAPNEVLDVLAALDAGSIDMEPGLEDEPEHPEYQCDDEGAIETDLGADDHGEAMTWSPPVWPRDGETQVPYHAL